MSGSALLSLARVRLADGDWHDGGQLLTALARVVEPGQATRVVRHAQHQHGVSAEHVAAADPAVVVARGQHAKARDALDGALRRGVLIADPARPVKDHWQGAATWRVRDPLAKTFTVAELAARLGLGETQPRAWIARGFVPTPRSTPGGQIRIPHEHLAVYERVRDEAYVYRGRWRCDPRTLWGDLAPELAARLGLGETELAARLGLGETQPVGCPHCGGRLLLMAVHTVAGPAAGDSVVTASQGGPV